MVGLDTQLTGLRGLNTALTSLGPQIFPGSSVTEPGALPAYLTGTPMDTLALTVQPGIYPFSVNSYSRQMQVSNDGISGWTNTGAPFSGTSFTITSLNGKYLRVIETATGDTQTLSTTSPARGPVVAFVALPSLPLAVGTLVGVIGDSYAGYNVYAGSPINPATGILSAADGFIEWARNLNPVFNIDTWYDTSDPLGRNLVGSNQGLFGDHMEPGGAFPGIIPRVPALLSHNPKAVVFLGGTNSINSGDTGTTNPAPASYVIQQLDQGYSLCRQAGVYIIPNVLYIRGDWPMGDPRYAILNAVNVWISSQSTRDGVLGVVDTNSILAPGGTQDPTMYLPDKVHLSAKGAKVDADNGLSPIIAASFASGSIFNQDPTVSNLLTASIGQLNGTTGAKSGSPIPTGNVPTGLTVTNARNASGVVCSIDALGGGLNGLRLDITPTDNNSAAYTGITVAISQVLASGNFVAGDWLEAEVFFEKISGTSLATSRLIAILKNGGATVQQTIGGYTSSLEFSTPNITPDGQGWWVKTQPYQVPTGVTFDRFSPTFEIYAPKTGSEFVVRLSRPIIRKITDPRTAWGY